jgi:3-oxoacyl-[acyl-carrier protein] reductase
LRFSKIAGIAYVASKAGIQGLTYQLAGEVGEFGIRVNCVAPGRIATPMSTIAAPGINEAAIAATPLRRLGTPVDIVGAILFLLSDAASFVTGQTIEVNGGRSL